MVLVRTTLIFTTEIKQLDTELKTTHDKLVAQVNAHRAEVHDESRHRFVACGLLALGIVMPLGIVRVLRRSGLSQNRAAGAPAASRRTRSM